VTEQHEGTGSYSYLGPAGTFTEAALTQVPEAVGKHWHSVHNVAEALDDVVSGRSIAAMIAIENSVEGGVAATQDALAYRHNLRIIGEYLVPVNFILVARPGTPLTNVNIVNAHPVAYAQCQNWFDAHLPHHHFFTPAPRTLLLHHPALLTTTTLTYSPKTLVTTPMRLPGSYLFHVPSPRLNPPGLTKPVSLSNYRPTEQEHCSQCWNSSPPEV
jgi:hypothetical protein